MNGLKHSDEIIIDGIKFSLVQKNPWMEFDCCNQCGHVDDAYRVHLTVCSACGSRDLSVKVGRWLTYHPRPTIKQSLAKFFVKDGFKIPCFRLMPQFLET